MRTTATLACAVLLALGDVAAVTHAGGGEAGAQQVFRGGVNTVPVYATVVDKDGRLVPDLGAGDFIVEDNGKRQKISVFKSDVQAITIAVLLDESPSLFPAGTRPQEAAIDFINRLLPGDRATLGFFSQVVTLNPSLSADKDVLIHRLGADAPFPAGTALWDAIDAGRTAVVEEPDRRVILVVTDAADNCSRSDIDTVRSNIERDGVMVYGIGIRGREGLQTSEMRALTRATGGWYFELRPQDDLATAVARVADELHRQYVLGFSPEVLDGRVHRIDVRAKKAGLTVRARRAYVASRDATIR